MFYRTINGYDIYVNMDKNTNYKYKVYKDNKFITNFGDKRYEQYYDKIGYYKNLNHLNKSRRYKYRQRHQNDNIDDPNYAGYWSWNFLW